MGLPRCLDMILPVALHHWHIAFGTEIIKLRFDDQKILTFLWTHKQYQDRSGKRSTGSGIVAYNNAVLYKKQEDKCRKKCLIWLKNGKKCTYKMLRSNHVSISQWFFFFLLVLFQTASVLKCQSWLYLLADNLTTFTLQSGMFPLQSYGRNGNIQTLRYSCGGRV